jgi:hypothetical protein
MGSLEVAATHRSVAFSNAIIMPPVIISTTINRARSEQTADLRSRISAAALSELRTTMCWPAALR